MHAFIVTVTIVGFLIIAWLLVKQFVLSSRWYFTDLLPMVSLCSIPMALVARSIEREGYTLDPLTIVFAICVGFILDFPIFIGAWWGLRVATILHEERPLRRLVLMLIGKLMVLGVIAWCGCLYHIAQAFAHRAQANERAVYFGLFLIVGLFLLLPGYFIEMRCRKISDKERARRIDSSRAAHKQKKDHALQASLSDSSSV